MINIHKTKFNAEKILVLGFALLIFIGSLLLNSKWASATGERLNYLDSLFIATSATCVTGLTVVDVAHTFSRFGKIIILILIQIGGLGFMMCGTFVLILLGRRISLKNRMLIRDAFNTDSLSGVVRLYMRGFLITMLLELIGVVMLSIRFIPLYGLSTGIKYSIFHSVSAFCNAGFDLFGDFNSFTHLNNEPFVLFTIAMLIIFGGTGFIVIDDMMQKKFHPRRFSLHTKIVIVMTASLIVLGTILLLITEYNNTKIWNEGDSFFHKLYNIIFQSVILRTAGFTSINVGDISDAGKLVSNLFMFIGASSGSTGGGIKTTTVFLLLLQTWNVIKGNDEVYAFSKQISKKQSSKAIATIIIAFCAVLISSWFICIFEAGRGHSFIDILYETVSAMATVGNSAIGTYNLTEASTVILIIIMFLGRLGPITIILAMGNGTGSKQNKLSYPEERILIG